MAYSTAAMTCPSWCFSHEWGDEDGVNPPGTIRHVAPIGRWLEVVRWTFPDGGHLDSIDLIVPPDCYLPPDAVRALAGDLQVAAGVFVCLPELNA